MVEFQPSKLAAWVRFPSPAPLKKAFFGALSSFLFGSIINVGVPTDRARKKQKKEEHI